jgi:alpha-beta hydrolase superfamily lysophospholipase
LHLHSPALLLIAGGDAALAQPPGTPVADLAVDVRMPSEPGVVLAGTLHMPSRPVRGPMPLAVFIQGHGRNGRGGFPVLIKRLNAEGIAALEYDKRGIGQSTGIYREDLYRLTADAAAAVAAMRRRPDIDPRRIVLIGHSQGGVIARGGGRRSGIAAVVMLAGSVGDGLPYLRGALRRQMILAGHPETAVDPAVDSVVACCRRGSMARTARRSNRCAPR